MPWGILEKKEHSFQNDNNPKTSYRSSSFTFRMRPCKTSLCCLDQGQFSITLLGDSKGQEWLQPGAASTEAGPKQSSNHMFN